MKQTIKVFWKIFFIGIGAFALLILLINVPFLGIAVLLAYLLALPWLLYRSMRFHLSNTTWRNLRFAFLGDAKGAYSALLLPIGIVVAAGAVSGLSMLISPFLGMGLLILTMLGFYGIGPYIQYRLRRYYTHGGRPCRYQRIRPAYWRRTVLPGLPRRGRVHDGNRCGGLGADRDDTWRGHRNHRYQG